MTVREMIKALEAIEDKDMKVYSNTEDGLEEVKMVQAYSEYWGHENRVVITEYIETENAVVKFK